MLTPLSIAKFGKSRFNALKADELIIPGCVLLRTDFSKHFDSDY